MILDMVQCDRCGVTHRMWHNMVPDSWIRHDGHHYCTINCFLAAHPKGMVSAQ